MFNSKSNLNIWGYGSLLVISLLFVVGGVGFAKPANPCLTATYRDGFGNPIASKPLYCQEHECWEMCVEGGGVVVYQICACEYIGTTAPQSGGCSTYRHCL
jgi:hypothetical protein